MKNLEEKEMNLKPIAKEDLKSVQAGARKRARRATCSIRRFAGAG